MAETKQVNQVEEFVQIQPGPCAIVRGVPVCPPTREIDCVEVLKVFDQCIKEEVIFREVGLPGPCVVAPTDVIECAVVFPDTTCDIFSFGTPDINNFRSIVIRQNVTIRVRVLTATGVERCVVTEGPFQVFQEVFLFAPEGTFGQCRIVAANCDCSVRSAGVGQSLFCRISLCKEVQVKALAKLLVPTFGFCQPEPCQVAPVEEVPCPPENLFPPQRCDVPDVVVLDVFVPGAGAAGGSEVPAEEQPQAQVQGVVVTVTRGANTFTATTDANEVARFPALVGGFRPGDIFNVGGKVFTLPAFCCRVTVVRERGVCGTIVRTLVFCDGRLILTLAN